MISVLHDGWPLSYHPNSPGAVHLLTLLEDCPPGVESVVLLPSAAPEWFPGGVITRLHPTPNTSGARLGWEQHILPGLARQLGVDLLHLTSLTPALIAPVPIVISPAGFGASKRPESELVYTAGSVERFMPGQRGVIDRLRQSLARGALDRVRAILWPEDIPYPQGQRQPGNWQIISPTVHPAFLTQQARPSSNELKRLPEDYFLYHGPSDHIAMQTLLRSWIWASRPIGEACPLVLVGLREFERQRVSMQLPKYGLEETVQLLPALSMQELAGLYQHCTGLFHPAPESLWGGPVRQALACGCPVVAAKTDVAEALVGPAAYLIDGRDTRAMGAALIIIVTEDSVATRLSRAARERSINFNQAIFQERLGVIYRTLGSK